MTTSWPMFRVANVERDLQGCVVEVLDNQGYDVILLMSTANISSMTARYTIFLSRREYCLHWFPLLLKIIRWGYRSG